MAEIRRIGTEEAFALPAQLSGYEAIGRSNWQDQDVAFWRAMRSGVFADVVQALLDIGPGRIALMDRHEVAMHLLLLTSPGVQVFDAPEATAMAHAANDALAAVIARYPTRFAGLAAIAPQDPEAAAKEMTRAVTGLGLNGFVVNSHTDGHYLDEPQFLSILETAAALKRPIYIHPRSLPDAAARPYVSHQLTGGIWGYAAETGLHAMRLILSGVFDRLPDLKIVLGHMGEGLPYWLYRMDYMYGLRTRRAPGPLKHLPSHYVRNNFAITTSGMNDPDILEFCLKKLGADNILWAIDYPYQETGEAVSFMDNAPVSRAVLEKLYHGNAERIFNIAPQAG